MVLSDSMMLKVCIPKNSRSTAYASFDGKHRVELRRGDVVQIEAGRYPFPTVVGERGASNEWFDSVRRALRWNTRGAVQGSFTASRSNPDAKPDADIDPVSEYARHLMEDDDESDEEPEEEEWDINPDPIEPHTGMDSGLGASEVSSVCHSPPAKFN
jgi:NAD+ kinase